MPRLTTVSAAVLPIILSLSSFPQHASAWGVLGHRTVAYIASSYVSSTTKSTIQTILGDTSSSYMANVSTWADDYRYTSAGAWSKPLHFIDANDSPPTSCSVDFDRDCGTAGCSISAIINYTSILQDSSASADEQYDAMRFIIHFIGDIHQPLHDEAIDVGGNTIDVTYDSTSTNLHHIWDTEMVEQLANTTSDSLPTANTFANYLLDAINSGTLGNSSSWISGMSLSDVEGTALGWASQANAYVCSDVLVSGVTAVESGDLSGSYFDKHADVARVQIARAGVRLGAWLNLIVTGSVTG